jgi:negative regulator of flagellin synthesis FlgM
MEVNNIGPTNGGQPIQRTDLAAESTPAEPRPVAPQDQLEISSVDSTNTQVELESEFRAQRISQIQQEIAAGVYETPEKLDAAVDRMLDRLLNE